ncbi:MAG: hypothetical protein JSW62_04680 [Thermoplasmatales archaeon]|nr:MAG: hypothetical protein JSW62_04680 [Thermoplasmatales archaeon]
MEKQLAILLVSFLLITVGLSGCILDEIVGTSTSSEKNRFVGTWVTDSLYDRLVLLENGKCKKFTYDGTWVVENDKIILTYAAGSKPHNYTYYYFFHDDNVNLTLTPVGTDDTCDYCPDKQIDPDRSIFYRKQQ